MLYVRAKYLPLRDAQPALCDARKTIVVEEPIVASGIEEVARKQHHLRRACVRVSTASVRHAAVRTHTHTHYRPLNSLRRTSSSGSCKICSISRIFRFGITCVRAHALVRVLVSARAFGIACARGCVSSGVCTPVNLGTGYSTLHYTLVHGESYRLFSGSDAHR